MSEEASEVAAFACCSAGIGRWLWVAWASESDARAFAPAVASGYEASAARAEAKVVERFGAGLKRLSGKWASGYTRRGHSAARVMGTDAEAEAEGRRSPGPKARIGRLRGPSRQNGPASRLAFLYSAAERDPSDSLGHVAVARHRIVKQTARKIHVECDPFDEDEWAGRGERDGKSPGDAPRPCTLAVDRVVLRTEGRFRCRHAYRELTFYASEEEGIRGVEADLTLKHAWCAVLGVRFPCSVDTIKAAYRRLARTTHPDVGGDPAGFRAIEQAYRDALVYLAPAADAASLPDTQ